MQVINAISNGTVRARAMLTAQNETAMVGIRQWFEQTIGTMGSAEKGYEAPLPAIIGSGAKP